MRWDPDAKRPPSDDDDGGDGDRGVNPGQWVRILSPPPHPPPRCSHTAVHHDGALYVFGGECASADHYHHYKDLWRFDLKSNTWEELRARGGSAPAARSGHRAVTWRRSMILFGGFHEALRSDTRWFNDVHLFDFQTRDWTELRYSKLARTPPPRSACVMAVGTAPAEALYVAGGYRNALGGGKTEGVVHADCWTLPLKPLVGAARGAPPPAWERLARKGECPSARAGASAALHRNKLLVFGGVLDAEGDGHQMDSVFYDDLFAFDVERRRWFAMPLKKAKAGGPGKRRRRIKSKNDDPDNEEEGGHDEQVESSEEEDPDDEAPDKNQEVVSSGWELDQLRQNMCAFIDGEGNVVYEKIDDEDVDDMEPRADGGEAAAEKDKEGPSTSTPTEEPDDSAPEANGTSETTAEPRAEASPAAGAAPPTAPSVAAVGRRASPSSVARAGDRGLPAPAMRRTPLPRINCATVVRNNTLYVYGGVLEVGDREVRSGPSSTSPATTRFFDILRSAGSWTGRQHAAPRCCA